MSIKSLWQSIRQDIQTVKARTKQLLDEQRDKTRAQGSVERHKEHNKEHAAGIFIMIQANSMARALWHKVKERQSSDCLPMAFALEVLSRHNEHDAPKEARALQSFYNVRDALSDQLMELMDSQDGDWPEKC